MKYLKFSVIFSGLMSFASAGLADVYLVCEEELHLVKADGSSELFTIYETDGAAADFEQAVTTAMLRSKYTCRKMYAEHKFGDGYDCPFGGERISCGYGRVAGAPERDPSLPNPPAKAQCYFKKETCKEATYPR